MPHYRNVTVAKNGLSQCVLGTRVYSWIRGVDSINDVRGIQCPAVHFTGILETYLPPSEGANARQGCPLGGGNQYPGSFESWVGRATSAQYQSNASLEIVKG